MKPKYKSPAVPKPELQPLPNPRRRVRSSQETPSGLPRPEGRNRIPMCGFAGPGPSEDDPSAAADPEGPADPGDSRRRSRLRVQGSGHRDPGTGSGTEIRERTEAIRTSGRGEPAGRAIAHKTSVLMGCEEPCHPPEPRVERLRGPRRTENTPLPQGQSRGAVGGVGKGVPPEGAGDRFSNCPDMHSPVLENWKDMKSRTGGSFGQGFHFSCGNGCYDGYFS